MGNKKSKVKNTLTEASNDLIRIFFCTIFFFKFSKLKNQIEVLISTTDYKREQIIELFENFDVIFSFNLIIKKKLS